jgi:hypothetical protein
MQHHKLDLFIENSFVHPDGRMKHFLMEKHVSEPFRGFDIGFVMVKASKLHASLHAFCFAR